MDALHRALQLCGGKTALAASLDLTHTAIYNWLHRPKGKIPAEYCPTIERLTKGSVRCEDLRPDVEWAVVRHRPRRKKPAADPVAPTPQERQEPVHAD